VTLLAPFGLAVALAAAAPAFDLSYRVWTAEDGLPQSSVYGIDQTADGYLWIATLDGLVRFDGVRMKVFNRSEVPEMTSNRLLCVRAARDGSLWLGSEDGGAMRRGPDGRFRSFGLADGLPNLFVASLMEDAQGRMWASTPSGLARFENGKWTMPPEAALRPGEQLEVFGRTVWRDGGIRLLEPSGALVDYPRPPPQGGWTVGLFGDSRGRSWFRAGRRSFLELHDGRATPMEAPEVDETKVEPPRWGAARGAGGRTWLLREGRLAVLDNGAWSVLDPSTSPPLPPPIAMLEDREGSLWIGGDSGLVQAVPTPIRTLVPGGGVGERSLYPLAEAADGRVWAGSWAGLFVVADGRFARRDDLAPRLGVVQTIEPEPDGGVLLGSTNGKVHRVTRQGAVETVFNGPPCSDMLRDPSGALWLATREGVVRVDGTGESRFRKAQGLAGESATVLFAGADGAIWAGTPGGLSRIEGGRVRSWTVADGLPGGAIRALYEDDKGALWIGTYDSGLARLSAGKIVRIRKRDGLFDDGVFAIVDDGAGRFWMSSNRGIFAADRAELDAFADGKARSVSCRAFGRADGMRSAECNGGYQPAGFRKSDGTLWFPTQEGIAVVDPRRLASNPIAPTVIIEEIASERRAHPAGPEVVLDSNERRLDVRFTATTFVRPAQVRFRYKLEGLDGSWADAGPDRLARLSFVPPGHYTFRVMASNSDGVWNEAGTSFALAVRPAWWETGWVRGGALVALIGIVVGLFGSRVARLKRRRAEQDAFARRLIASQEAERKRIAGELHDGIGQTLVAIRNRALLGLRGDPAAPKTRGHVELIVDVASQGIDEIRKVAHGLRPYQLDRLGLTRALEALLEQAGTSSEIALTSEIAPLDGIFPREDEIQVYRIVQEAVGNVVRHSGAKNARVSISAPDGAVEILVEDDGKGFEPTAQPSGRSGMGLSGIAERVRILSGRHTIHSAPGRGTRLIVILPKRGGEAAG